MPAAAAKSKPKPLSVRELCQELLELERDNPAIFARMDAIKTSLKLEADKVGSFRETFADLGYVSVSPSKAAETIGEAPEVDVGEWSALTQAKRDRYIDAGVIKMAPIIKGASYGQVRTKLHVSPQGAAK